ncbi:MAG: YfiR family protein [Pirellulales bacterium]|nr:YfiR family protein [Pirellulales bacterium]
MPARSVSPVAAQTSDWGVISREYAIKAAYLYNFGRYVTWPPEAFPSTAAPFVISLIGQDRTAPYLEKIARDGEIAGRSIVVQRLGTAEDFRPCHILFIGRHATAEQRLEILRRVGNLPVLVVGETPGFAQQDGIVNFYIAGNKIRFEINHEAAKQKGLRISAKLLALSKIVP